MQRIRFALTIILLAGMARVVHAQQYTITDLGTLGADESTSWKLNNFGQVIGTLHLTNAGSEHAFLWTPDTENGTTGHMNDLGILDGTGSQARGINDFGQVVGYITHSGFFRAFLWTPTTTHGSSGTMVDLGTLGGTASTAESINNAGKVVGGSRISAVESRAYLWTPNIPNGNVGSMVSLGRLHFSTVSKGFLINNSDLVVGINNVAISSGTGPYPFYWTPSSGMQDIGTLGGPFGNPFGISNDGKVVGQAQLENGLNHAFLWTQAGGVRDLTPDANYSQAVSINASGQAVGYTDMPGFSGLFLWTQSTGFVKIIDHIPANSGWILTSEGIGINDAGQIVGTGTNSAGKTHAFLLTPITVSRVSGTITLEGIVPNAVSQPLTLTFHPLDNSGDIVKIASLPSSGVFAVTDIPRKSYTLHIKGSKWLAKNVAVNASNGDVTGVTALLFAGDANNDNAADIADLLVLINAYNRSAPDSHYSEAADFNCDGSNDIADLLLLIRNYNRQGDS